MGIVAKSIMLLTSIGLCSLAVGQTDPMHVTGEIQIAVVAGQKDSGSVIQHHASRAKLDVTTGNWEFVASYLLYPLYNFNAWDETTVSYRAGKTTFRIGRMLPVLFQSSWYDQWNSGLIFFPDEDRWQYFGTLSPWQTNPGIDIQTQFGNSTLTVSAIDIGNLTNDKMIPTRFDRQFVRFQTFIQNWVLGASAYGDFRNLTDGEHLGELDFRTAGDHWVWRGEFVAANKYDQNYHGLYTDFAYRPPGQDKLTLLGRYDTSRYESGPIKYNYAGITIGAKYTLPQDFVLSANYIFGNTQLRNGFWTGWIFGLQKTYAF